MGIVYCALQESSRRWTEEDLVLVVRRENIPFILALFQTPHVLHARKTLFRQLQATVLSVVSAMLGLREQMAVLVRAVYQVNTRKGKAMPIARNADLESIRLMQQLPTRICARTAQKEAIFQPPETQHLWTVLHAMQEHILIKSA